jgi:hypothetical protein
MSEGIEKNEKNELKEIIEREKFVLNSGKVKHKDYFMYRISLYVFCLLVIIL